MNINRQHLILIGIILLALALRLYHIADHYPGIDEALTMRVAAGMPFGTASFSYFHPPAFFFLVQMFQLLPEPLLLLRLLMAFIGAGVVLISYFFSKEITDTRTASLIAFLVAISPMGIIYSQHVRPYIIFSALFLLSTWLLYRFIHNKPRSLIALPLLYALAFYNHYLSGIFILSHLIAVVFLCRITPLLLKKYLAVLGVTFLLISPIVFHFATNVSDLSRSPETWMGSLDPLNIPYPLYKYSVMADVSTTLSFFPPVLLLFPLILLLALRGFFSFRKNKTLLWFFFLTFFMVFALYIAASFYIIVYFFRYLTFLLPLYIIFTGIGLQKTRPWLRYLLIAIIVIGWAVVLNHYYAVSTLSDAWGIDIGV